ncbi:hypothetical protein IAT38_005919 [Cryptococcus sp. DSM 104549]
MNTSQLPSGAKGGKICECCSSSRSFHPFVARIVPSLLPVAALESLVSAFPFPRWNSAFSITNTITRAFGRVEACVKERSLAGFH